MMDVEVVYATPEKQTLLVVHIPQKSNVAEVIKLSGILSKFPELKLETLHVGIFSTPCELERELKQGERVEIYRPLQNDPKVARRQRALKK